MMLTFKPNTASMCASITNNPEQMGSAQGRKRATCFPALAAAAFCADFLALLVILNTHREK